MIMRQWILVLGVLTSFSGAAKAEFDIDQCSDKLRHLAEAEFPGPDGSQVIAESVDVVSADAHRITYDVGLRRRVGGCGAGFVRFVTDENCQIVGTPN